MKLLEIHKNGINAHHKEVSYYGVDYNTKRVLFDSVKSLNEAIDNAISFGYKKEEMQFMF